MSNPQKLADNNLRSDFNNFYHNHTFFNANQHSTLNTLKMYLVHAALDLCIVKKKCREKD